MCSLINAMFDEMNIIPNWYSCGQMDQLNKVATAINDGNAHLTCVPIKINGYMQGASHEDKWCKCNITFETTEFILKKNQI